MHQTHDHAGGDAQRMRESDRIVNVRSLAFTLEVVALGAGYRAFFGVANSPTTRAVVDAATVDEATAGAMEAVAAMFRARTATVSDGKPPPNQSQ